MLTLQLAYRNVLRQRRRSLLTGLSMTGGYALFVFSLSLLFGSYGNVINLFVSDRTGHIQIHDPEYRARPAIHKAIDTEAINTTLDKQAGVKHYTTRVFAPGLAYGDEKTSPAQIVGIDSDREALVTRIVDKVKTGEYFGGEANADGYYSALVGYSIARSLDLAPRDEIILISQGADGSIANDIFLVAGIVGNKNAFDRNTVYLPLSAAQQFLSMGESVHEYVLVVSDPDANRDIANDLQAALPAVEVAPWQVVEETFYRTMESDKQGNYFSIGLIVFIVFIGVLNTVLMSVLERTREFGVLMAIGCPPNRLVLLILMETLMLASFSILAGLVLSIPAVWWLAEVGFSLSEPIDLGGVPFRYIRGEFTTWVFTVPMAFILATAALISLPPGFRAARILPRDALGGH